MQSVAILTNNRRDHRESPDSWHLSERFMNRRLLLLGSMLSFSGMAAVAAQPVNVPELPNLAGRWTISATRDATGSKDVAVLSIVSSQKFLLRLDGELSKALGGSVELLNHASGELTGKSATGSQVTVRVINDRRLDLTISGTGVYFAFFLLR